MEANENNPDKDKWYFTVSLYNTAIYLLRVARIPSNISDLDLQKRYLTTMMESLSLKD
jgi:hypothetical protein